MSHIRIALVILLGIAVINALPTSKPTSKPALSKLGAKLASKTAALKNKSLISEERKIRDSEKPELAIENAEEPKKGDRQKKSAVTSFCVEVRNSPEEPPTKVCEPPTVVHHHEYHEHHEHHEAVPTTTASPPVEQPDCYIEENPQPPITIIQPPQTRIVCPNSQHAVPAAYSVQQPSDSYQHPPVPDTPPQQLPSVPTIVPCPCSGGSPSPFKIVQVGNKIIYSHHSGRSATGPADSMFQMRSDEAGEPNGIEAQLAPVELDQQNNARVAMDNPDVAYARTFYQKPAAGFQYPPVAYTSYHHHPASGSCGSGFRAAPAGNEASGSTQADGLSESMAAKQMGMDMGQGAARTFHPISSMGSMMTNPVMQRPSMSYGYHVLPRGYNAHQAMMPESKSWYQQVRHQRQQNEEEAKNIEEEKKPNELSGPLSPSELLNKMRGKEGRKINPTMQTFPRDNEAQNGKGALINVHIPASGIPTVSTNLPKVLKVEKSVDSKTAEIEKRETASDVSLKKE